MLKFPPFTLETIFILPLAIGFDLISIFLVLFLLDDFGILDIVATIFIGSWLFFRTRRIPERKGSLIRRVFTGRQTKFLVPIFGELIPYLGVLPFWTLTVYINLTQ